MLPSCCSRMASVGMASCPRLLVCWIWTIQATQTRDVKNHRSHKRINKLGNKSLYVHFLVQTMDPFTDIKHSYCRIWILKWFKSITSKNTNPNSSLCSPHYFHRVVRGWHRREWHLQWHLLASVALPVVRRWEFLGFGLFKQHEQEICWIIDHTKGFINWETNLFNDGYIYIY